MGEEEEEVDRTKGKKGQRMRGGRRGGIERDKDVWEGRGSGGKKERPGDVEKRAGDV
jgi:hypothetical protein